MVVLDRSTDTHVIRDELPRSSLSECVFRSSRSRWLAIQRNRRSWNRSLLYVGVAENMREITNLWRYWECPLALPRSCVISAHRIELAFHVARDQGLLGSSTKSWRSRIPSFDVWSLVVTTGYFSVKLQLICPDIGNRSAEVKMNPCECVNNTRVVKLKLLGTVAVNRVRRVIGVIPETI